MSKEFVRSKQQFLPCVVSWQCLCPPLTCNCNGFLVLKKGGPDPPGSAYEAESHETTTNQVSNNEK